MNLKKPDEIPWTPTGEWSKRILAMLYSFLLSPITPWFFVGMATEAFGLALQSSMNMSAYPGFDFIVGAIIAMFLFYYQKNEHTGGNTDDDDVESPDQTAD